MLARWKDVASVVGVDLAPSLLERAKELAGDIANVSFKQADARVLPFENEAFDVAVFDSTLTHVPEPERALAEAFRVLRQGGLLAVFDGDYATTTVALGDNDPLQTCVDAMLAHSVTDRWLARRLPALVRACGFEVASFRSHGFAEATDANYMLTIVDRGIEILRTSGQLGDEAAVALKDESRRRVEQGCFFGHIAYLSLIASAPPGRK
jgi:ubiquinone/menaquinone biosynthesis C-methylase UbiE